MTTFETKPTNFPIYSFCVVERKNMNLPGVKVDLPTFTEKDVNDIVNFGKSGLREMNA